jgi:murein DD-endopeptidase MepM/ murein hydrolase activator NlpD
MRFVRIAAVLALGSLLAFAAPASARHEKDVSGTTTEVVDRVEMDALPALVEKSFAKLGTTPRPRDGFRWPIRGLITTYFGGGHNGIDIDALAGDPILAAADGRVTFAGDDGDGYGTKVVIRHVKGYSTLYSHLSSMEVSRGDRVRRGDLVGGVGCTGSCSGDHLHFEILRGDAPVDPLDKLPEVSG